MVKKTPKICFVADSHDLYDDRIYWKQACSLAKNGFEVHYVLAGQSDAEGLTSEGIHYCIVKRDQSANRYVNYLLKRYAPGGLYNRLFKKAAQTGADVFHLHDLKVLRIAGRLKKQQNNPRLVYDVHEPYPENMLDYDHGSKNRFRKQMAGWIRHWERRKASVCDLIITTEENLQQRFADYYPSKPVEIIYNYTNLPLAGDLLPFDSKPYDAIYTGGITRLRGAMNILKAAKLVVAQQPGFKILFLGTWFPAQLKSEMTDYINANHLAEHVILKDAVDYQQVAEYYQKSKTGLGIFLPIPTHQIILQIKIFEYMNFGLPIIGSNFGHINRIIHKHACGIAVDAENPDDIAHALLKVLGNKNLYAQMSLNGRQAAAGFYQWKLMEEKLLAIYKQLIN